MNRGEARIFLAEKMGWTQLDLNLTGWWMPPGITLDTHKFHIQRVPACDLPDPFTDANDDYAVLECMGKYAAQTISERPDGGYLDWVSFTKHLSKDRWPLLAQNYHVGDYARAACAVFDIEIEDIEER